jgi:hypothetical protein
MENKRKRVNAIGDESGWPVGNFRQMIFAKQKGKFCVDRQAGPLHIVGAGWVAHYI